MNFQNRIGSFFGNDSVVVTALLGGGTVEEIMNRILVSVAQGAQGLAIDLGSLPLELRTVENYRRIMNTAPQHPFMFVLYRTDRFLGNDDEARQKYLIGAAEAGCEVVDVMGDLYDPSPFELTVNPAAIAKQKALIQTLHGKGAKVVMSSHMKVSRKSGEVLAHLQEEASRGADLLKIVITVDTEEEFVEYVQTLFLLKKELTRPFIFLCNGKYARIARFLGAKLGVSVTFATLTEQPDSTLPTVEQYTNVLRNIHWPMLSKITG